MKRSSQITLVLLTSAAGLSLAGCDAQPAVQADNGGTFTSLAQCVAQYDQKTCAAAQQLAQQEHLQNAPHFSDLQACREQYGPDMCQPASAYGGQSNIFVPMMIGYMLGSANSQPAPLYYAPYAYRHYGQAGYSAPIYSSSPSYRNTGPIGSAPLYRPSARGGLNASTALSSGTVRGGFGSSFKPTPTFKSTYSAANPDSFGRGGYSKATGAMSSKSFSSYTSSRASSFSSGTTRGGFGSSGRSFGGGFGG